MQVKASTSWPREQRKTETALARRGLECLKSLLISTLPPHRSLPNCWQDELGAGYSPDAGSCELTAAIQMSLTDMTGHVLGSGAGSEPVGSMLQLGYPIAPPCLLSG